MADAKWMRWFSTLPHKNPASAHFINSFSLDATTDQAEVIFQAREAATITRLGALCGSITGSSPVYKISLQGVASTGYPDGTILGGGSPASKTFTPTASTWAWHTLDNSYACTAGQLMAWVISYESGTIDGSNFAAFRDYHATSQAMSFPYWINNAAGSRTKANTGTPVFGFGSAGKAYGYPLSAAYSQTIQSDTTPDEVGIKFTVPTSYCSTFKVAGVFINVPNDSGALARVQLYDTDGTTVLQGIDIDSDQFASAAGRPGEVLFDDTAATLNAGSAYRVGFRGSDTGLSWYWDGISVAAAADLDAYPGGQDVHGCTRTDDGAWTEVTTSRPWIDLLLVDITAPSGGGGGLILPRSLGGGLV